MADPATVPTPNPRIVPNTNPPPPASAGFGDAVQIEAVAGQAYKTFLMAECPCWIVVPYQQVMYHFIEVNFRNPTQVREHRAAGIQPQAEKGTGNGAPASR